MTVLTINQPKIKLQGKHATTTSLNLAEVFGRRHRDVMRRIRKLDCSPEFMKANFCAVAKTVAMPQGGTRRFPYYNITRDGFTILAMGFTGAKAMQFKEAYIAAFNAMEASLCEPSQQDEMRQLMDGAAYLRGKVIVDREHFFNMANKAKNAFVIFDMMMKVRDSFTESVEALENQLNIDLSTSPKAKGGKLC